MDSAFSRLGSIELVFKGYFSLRSTIVDANGITLWIEKN
jgi:hypothetical protein